MQCAAATERGPRTPQFSGGPGEATTNARGAQDKSASGEPCIPWGTAS